MIGKRPKTMSPNVDFGDLMKCMQILILVQKLRSSCYLYKHTPIPDIMAHGGCDYMVVGFIIPVQSVPITTNVVSSNPVYNDVYSIQHYVIKFVSHLRQVSGFLRVLRFPPPIKLTTTIYMKYC